MKNNLFSSIFAVTVSLTMVQPVFSQDVVSEVKVAVLAENADIAAVVKAAAQANPTQAAMIAQAAVKALELRSNDAADEAVIESIIQAAILGSKAPADQAKSIRAVAESALISSDSSSNPIQGGAVEGENVTSVLNFAGGTEAQARAVLASSGLNLLSVVQLPEGGVQVRVAGNAFLAVGGVLSTGSNATGAASTGSTSPSNTTPVVIVSVTTNPNPLSTVITDIPTTPTN